MFGYRLLKFFTFFIYWLGFAPWLVLLLRKEEILSAFTLQDIFLQYTTVLFILILLYLIINRVFEYFYLRHQIKKTVRKITIRHQLKRFKRGEIDLIAAQRLSTFTKLKECEPKKSVASGTSKTKEKDKREAKAVNSKKSPKNSEKEDVLEKAEKGEIKNKVAKSGEINKIALDKQLDGKKRPPSYQEVIVNERRESTNEKEVTT